jgi:hypothetical protein
MGGGQGRAEPRPIRLEGTPQQLEWVKQIVSEKINVPVDRLASTQAWPGLSHTPAAAAASGGAGGGGAAGGAGGSGITVSPAPGGQGIVMSVPNESVGLVIGRGGVTIKTMEAQASRPAPPTRQSPSLGQTPALPPWRPGQVAATTLHPLHPLAIPHPSVVRSRRCVRKPSRAEALRILSYRTPRGSRLACSCCTALRPQPHRTASSPHRSHSPTRPLAQFES